MSAFEEVELLLHRHEGRRPGVPRLVDVEVATARIRRHVVVAVARQASEPRVAIEAIDPALMGHEPKEVLVSEVVDPRIRSLRGGDDVFFVAIVEMTKTHDYGA